MPRMGLNRQSVVNAAITLIEEKGNQNFSMRELADRLQIKQPLCHTLFLRQAS